MDWMSEKMDKPNITHARLGQGKVAVVTGGGSQGSGIGNGRAASILLAERGYTVLVVDKSLDSAEETCRMVAADGGQAVAVAADVSQPDECKSVIEQATKLDGTLEVLVNNVGVVGPPGTVVDVDLEGWNSTFAVNVTSMLLMSRFAMPHMVETGRGSIVNVSSLAGTISHPRIAYATTKGAIVSLTRSMAVAHGADGIRVNCVAPGLAYTPIVQVEGLTEEARRQRAEASPLKVEGTGWDVGGAIAYLASEESRWITGACLPVDGGFSADLRLSAGATVTPAHQATKQLT